MFVFSVLAEYSIILAINGKIRKKKQKLEQEVSSNDVNKPSSYEGQH